MCTLAASLHVEREAPRGHNTLALARTRAHMLVNDLQTPINQTRVHVRCLKPRRADVGLFDFVVVLRTKALCRGPLHARVPVRWLFLPLLESCHCFNECMVDSTNCAVYAIVRAYDATRSSLVGPPLAS